MSTITRSRGSTHSAFSASIHSRLIFGRAPASPTRRHVAIVTAHLLPLAVRTARGALMTALSVKSLRRRGLKGLRTRIYSVRVFADSETRFLSEKVRRRSIAKKVVRTRLEKRSQKSRRSHEHYSMSKGNETGNRGNRTNLFGLLRFSTWCKRRL